MDVRPPTRLHEAPLAAPSHDGYDRRVIVSRLNEQTRAPHAAAGWDDLRAHNAGVVLRAAWTAERISRADLARQTGLSRATISDIVAEFVSGGLLADTEDSAPRSSSGGRPPTIVRFVDDCRQILGIELGASHVAVVRTDLRGRVLARAGVEVDTAASPAATLTTMVDLARTACDDAPEGALIGVGLALPTPLRHGEGARLSPRLFPRWDGVDVAEPLALALGVPVYADNDANLGALGEHWWGAGRGVGDLAYIKVATGVGAGVLIGGEIYRGARGIAGEIGHTSIDPAGPRCRCGLTGCLEAFVGTSYLLERAERVASQRPASVAALIDAARTGDPVARAVVEDAGRHLGVAVANLLNLVNPARVVLGGRLTDVGAPLLDALQESVHARALWSSVDGYDVVLGTLGDDAVAIGAATSILRAALLQPARHFLPAPSPVLARRGASAVTLAPT